MTSDPPVVQAVDRGDQRMLQLLLTYGAAANATSVEGKAAIVVAIERGSREMATMLLRHGADPNRSDEVGRSALEIAVKRGDDEAAKLLLNHGARIRVCDAGNCVDAAAEARARGDSELSRYIEALARTQTP